MGGFNPLLSTQALSCRKVLWGNERIIWWSRGAGSGIRVYNCCHLHQRPRGRGGIILGPARWRFLPHFIDFCSCEISDAGDGFHRRNQWTGQKTQEQECLLTLTWKHSLSSSWCPPAFLSGHFLDICMWTDTLPVGEEEQEKPETRNTTARIVSPCLNHSNKTCLEQLRVGIFHWTLLSTLTDLT